MSATVLHVTQPTDARVGTYVRALCADQSARGLQVEVACPDDGRLPAELRQAGVTRRSWSAVRSPDARTLDEVRRLRQIVQHVQPDVVHLHSSKAGLVGRLAIRGELPTLFQPHGWSWLADGRLVAAASLRWERYAQRWTTVSVCVGQGEADLGFRHGLAGPSIVVSNGVDLDHFRPASPTERREARVRLGLPMADPIAVCVGRVTRQKGQDLLLAGWPSIRDKHPDALLAVVGDGPMIEPIRRRRMPGVVLPGLASDTRPWYQAADVIVLPSRRDRLPLTLLEAMAVGRSVVATAMSAIEEVLPAGAGALVTPDDPVALADAVCRRLCRPDIADAEGAAATAYARSTLDIRHAHDQLAIVTAQLAADRVSAPAVRRTGEQSDVPDRFR